MKASNHTLSNLEALFFALEARGSPTQLAWLCRLNSRLPLSTLRAHARERLKRIPHSRDCIGNHTVFLQAPFWTEDPAFSLARHVKSVATTASTLEELLEVCRRLLWTPWNLQHPLWEITLLQPVRAPSSILVRAHRSILPFENEGEFLNALLDPQPLARKCLPGAPRVKDPLSHPLGGRRFINQGTTILWRALRHPYDAASGLRTYFESVVSSLRTALTLPPPVAALNGPRSHNPEFNAVQFPLNDVRQIRNRLGGSVFEILLSSIIGGLSSALGDHFPETGTPEILACVPLTTGSEQDAQRTGTRTTLAVARLPLTTRNPVERLRKVSAELDLLRAIHIPEQYRRTLQVVREIPPPAFHALLKLMPHTAPVHTMCLDLPSIRERRYLAGNEVKQIVPIAPLVFDLRVAFVVQAYAEQVTIGVTADPQSRLTARGITRGIRVAQRELEEAAGLIQRRQHRLGSDS